MNYTTPAFSLKVTQDCEVTLTPEVIALLIPAIQHAVTTGTKHDETPNLGANGGALIREVRRLHKLSLYDAAHNVRRMVKEFEVKDFDPPYDWSADIEAAKRVLDRLHDRGCIGEWACADLVNDMYRVCR